MSIPLKLEDLVNAQNSLNALAAMELPISTSYKIAKILKIIENETDIYWSVRKNALEPFADEKGMVNYPDAETRRNIEKEIQKVLDTEVSLDIKALPIKVLGEIDLAPSILAGAWFMFKD